MTLPEKVWADHVVVAGGATEPDLIYIDLHLIHEVTSPQAFDGLRLAGRGVRRPDLTLATEDHNVPTVDIHYKQLGFHTAWYHILRYFVKPVVDHLRLWLPPTHSRFEVLGVPRRNVQGTPGQPPGHHQSEGLAPPCVGDTTRDDVH